MASRSIGLLDKLPIGVRLGLLRGCEEKMWIWDEGGWLWCRDDGEMGRGACEGGYVMFMRVLACKRK